MASLPAGGLQIRGACSYSSVPSSSGSGSSVHKLSSALPQHVASVLAEPVAVKQWKFSLVSSRELRRSAAVPVIRAAGKRSDSSDEFSSTGEELSLAPLAGAEQMPSEGIILSPARTSLQVLSQDMAMSLVMRAAGRTGWTTGSGLEGPSGSLEGEGNPTGATEDSSYLSKSPRRRMRVAFTCNVCGERTTRSINPHAYTDGTVFVQCKGCDVFHKLVDNLNLFHELKGRIYDGYGIKGFAHHESKDILGLDDTFSFL